MASGQLTRLALRALDYAARATGLEPRLASHLVTGKLGEEDAYFYLRRLGYVIVARNFRSPRRRGEIDLVGWDGGTLCFIEVKTRSTRAVKPAEAAVDRDKQEELVGMARQYLRRTKGDTLCRFDVLSVYVEKTYVERPRGAAEITLFKNAFGMP
jgi:putative endonuclease